MDEVVFDIECNGLEPTKIHCLGASVCDSEHISTTTQYNHIGKLVKRPDVALIAHNCIRYDLPVIKRLVGVEPKGLVVDTLALSWYLYPKRNKHGLEDWGEEFGVPKPPVYDWENEPIEVYLHRVTEDVKINMLLWQKMKRDLLNIYQSEEEMWRFIRYITFKMECAKDQEEQKWLLDVPRTRDCLQKVTEIRDKAFEQLKGVMPSVPIRKKKKRPMKPYKESGELSVYGVNWFNLLKEQGLPDSTLECEVVDGYNEPNPASHVQMKKWLFDLGWEPQTFEYKRNKETGEVRKIPQITIKDSGGDVCQSVKNLYKKEPNLKILEGLSVATHRISVFEGFLENVDDDGYIYAGVGGLTNTLRFKHRVLVNLPGIDKPFGKDIRGCLVCPAGSVLVGSDMAALEDRTKQHYIYPYDPDYVNDMMEEGYCPHVDIAVLAGFLSKEQEERHKTGSFIDSKDEKEIKAGRKKAKPVNYGGTYGQRAKGLSQQTGMPLKQAENLTDIYLKRNWALEAIAKDCEVKTISGQMWLYNPVSRFWYSLRYEKDRFSTLNQGTGVYCFDCWVMEQRKRGLIPIGQFHDEVVLVCRKGQEAVIEGVLRESIVATNKKLKLNRELDIDVQFGENYSQIH